MLIKTLLFLNFFVSNARSFDLNLNTGDEEATELLHNVTLKGFTPLLGGPSTRSTTDCGYSSGNLPDIPSG